MGEHFRMALRTGFYFGVKAQGLVSQAAFDHFFQTNKGAPTNEGDVTGGDWEKLLLGMRASAVRRHVGDRPFQNLEQRLLHAFTGNVSCDRRVLVFSANLIDLVDIDDPLLRAFDVAVGCLQQFQNNVFDVFANIAGLSQRGGIDYGEWHAEQSRQRLGQQRLPGARGPDQQDVGFLNLDIGAPARNLDSFVVLVNRNCQTLLGVFLADYVFVEKVLNLTGLWQRRPAGYRLGLLIVGNYLVADVNALIADINRGPCDELLHFIL